MREPVGHVNSRISRTPDSLARPSALHQRHDPPLKDGAARRVPNLKYRFGIPRHNGMLLMAAVHRGHGIAKPFVPGPPIC